MNSVDGPKRQMVQVGSGKRAIWRPGHQHAASASRHLPKIHYLPPTAGNSNGAWRTSGMFLDFEIPKEIGVVSGLNLRFEIACDVSGGQLAPPTPHWVQQIEITVGSQIVETLYPQDIFNETVGFLNKDDLDSTNEVLLVNPNDYITVDQKIPNTGIYGSNFFAYLPFNSCITAAKFYNAGVDDPLKFRVYFPPNLFPVVSEGGASKSTTLSSATLIIEEEYATPETRADYERASKEGITYATVVRQRQNQTVNRNTGSSNTIDLTGVNGASAGLIIYAGPVVTAGGNANNVQLTTRYEISTLELDDNLGSKKEGLEQQRGEYLTSFVWANQIQSPFPARANAFTYLLPFCPAFKEAVVLGVNSGALQISTKGNDRLVLNNHTGTNTTWSLTITNYAHQAFVVQNRRLVSVIKDWSNKAM